MLNSFLALFAALLISSYAGAQTPGVTDTEIKLGNHSVQSGSQAAYGVLQRAMKAEFERVNEQGGVFGRKINLLIGDSAGNNQQALQVIRKQVEEDKVFAVVGGGNGPHLAVYKYLRQKGVPDLWIGNGTSEYSKPPFKTTFGWTPTSEGEAEFYVKYFAKRWPKKKVAVIYDTSSIGKSGAETFKKMAEGKLDVVAVEASDSRMDPGAKAQILNVKKAGAEVVYMLTLVGVTPVAMKFAHEQGYNPQFVLSVFNAYQKTLDLAGAEATDGALGWYYTYTEGETDNPEVKKHFEFVKKYMPNEKPSVNTMAGQGMGELMVETLRRAGKNPTRDSLVAAAESFKDWKCSVCRAPHSTGPNKHVFNTVNELYVAKGGKWIPYRDEWSTPLIKEISDQF